MKFQFTTAHSTGCERQCLRKALVQRSSAVCHSIECPSTVPIETHESYTPDTPRPVTIVR